LDMLCFSLSTLRYELLRRLSRKQRDVIVAMPCWLHTFDIRTSIRVLICWMACFMEYKTVRCAYRKKLASSCRYVSFTLWLWFLSLLRRGADKSLPFPISYFPIATKPKKIFLDGLKKLEQRSQICGAPAGICRVNIYFFQSGRLLFSL
jgi:hypothetical protein